MKKMESKIVVLLAVLLVYGKVIICAEAKAKRQAKEEFFQEIVLVPHAQYNTPFEPQLGITKEQQECTVFVPQQFYVVMDKNTSIQRAIVGPCCPCFMVAVRNEQQDRAFACHIPYNTDDFKKSLTEVMSQNFLLEKEKGLFDWKVVLFSKSFAQAPEELKQECEWNEKKQERCLKSLKKCLQNFLKKYARTVSLQTMLFKETVQGLSRTEHPEIDKSVAVSRGLQIASVCLLSQKLYEFMPPTKSEGECFNCFYPEVFSKYMKLFGQPKGLARIPDEQAGLQKLQPHLKFVLKKQKHIDVKKKDDAGAAE